MARAATKVDLIKSADEQFDKMRKLVDSMTDDLQNKSFSLGENPGKSEAHWTRDKNLCDVFIHLYEWHNLLLNWVNSNQNGDSKPFLPAPYNWKTSLMKNCLRRNIFRGSEQQVWEVIAYR